MSTNRILIVDDNESFCKFLHEAVRGWGFDAQIATNHGDVQARYESHRPEIVVLDLQMPDVDGVQTLRFLAERECAAKILLLSGFDAAVTRAAARLGESLGLDMLGPLAKPVRMADLESALRCTVKGAAAFTRSDLQRAIAEEEISLVYQPKVVLASRALVGVEALARWNPPRSAVVMPGDFIPVFEREQMVGELFRATCRLAFEQMAAWRGRFDAGVAINMAPVLLLDLDLPDYMIQMSAANGVSPERVTVEVTETQAMSDPICANEVLSRLRLKGFRTSLDDFGTGYSSLLWLHRLPFCELKIDRSFVSELAQAAEAKAIVRTTIDLARSLGLEACAEGVESAAIWEELVALGCELAQGYFISPPLPPDEIPAWAERWYAACGLRARAAASHAIRS